MQMSSAMETETGGMIVKRVSVPIGLDDMMEGLTKEVLLKKPNDIYLFAAEYFARLLLLREKGNYKAKPLRTVQSITGQISKQPAEKLLIRGASKKLSRQISIRGESPVKKLVSNKHQSTKDPSREIPPKSRLLNRRSKQKATETKSTEITGTIEEKQKTAIKRDRSLSTSRSSRSVNKGTPREKSNFSPKKTENGNERGSPTKFQSKDKVEYNKNSKNKEESNKKQKQKILSVEEDKEFVKDGQLTVIPPKIIKHPQPANPSELISSIVVPQVMTNIPTQNPSEEIGNSEHEIGNSKQIIDETNMSDNDNKQNSLIEIEPEAIVNESSDDTNKSLVLKEDIEQQKENADKIKLEEKLTPEDAEAIRNANSDETKSLILEEEKNANKIEFDKKVTPEHAETKDNKIIISSEVDKQESIAGLQQEKNNDGSVTESIINDKNLTSAEKYENRNLKLGDDEESENHKDDTNKRANKETIDSSIINGELMNFENAVETKNIDEMTPKEKANITKLDDMDGTTNKDDIHRIDSDNGNKDNVEAKQIVTDNENDNKINKILDNKAETSLLDKYSTTDAEQINTNIQMTENNQSQLDKEIILDDINKKTTSSNTVDLEKVEMEKSTKGDIKTFLDENGWKDKAEGVEQGKIIAKEEIISNIEDHVSSDKNNGNDSIELQETTSIDSINELKHEKLPMDVANDELLRLNDDRNNKNIVDNNTINVDKTQTREIPKDDTEPIIIEKTTNDKKKENLLFSINNTNTSEEIKHENSKKQEEETKENKAYEENGLKQSEEDKLMDADKTSLEERGNDTNIEIRQVNASNNEGQKQSEEDKASDDETNVDSDTIEVKHGINLNNEDKEMEQHANTLTNKEDPIESKYDNLVGDLKHQFYPGENVDIHAKKDVNTDPEDRPSKYHIPKPIEDSVILEESNRTATLDEEPNSSSDEHKENKDANTITNKEDPNVSKDDKLVGDLKNKFYSGENFDISGKKDAQKGSEDGQDSIILEKNNSTATLEVELNSSSDVHNENQGAVSNKNLSDFDKYDVLLDKNGSHLDDQDDDPNKKKIESMENADVAHNIKAKDHIKDKIAQDNEMLSQESTFLTTTKESVEEKEMEISNNAKDSLDSNKGIIPSTIDAVNKGIVNHVVKACIGDFIQSEKHNVFVETQIEPVTIPLSENASETEIEESVVGANLGSENTKPAENCLDNIKCDVKLGSANHCSSDVVQTEEPNVFIEKGKETLPLQRNGNETDTTKESLKSGEYHRDINREEKLTKIHTKKENNMQEEMNEKGEDKVHHLAKSQSEKKVKHTKKLAIPKPLSQANLLSLNNNLTKNESAKIDRKIRRVKTVDAINLDGNDKSEIKSRIPTADYRSRVKREAYKHSASRKEKTSTEAAKAINLPVTKTNKKQVDENNSSLDLLAKVGIKGLVKPFNNTKEDAQQKDTDNNDAKIEKEIEENSEKEGTYPHSTKDQGTNEESSQSDIIENNSNNIELELHRGNSQLSSNQSEVQKELLAKNDHADEDNNKNNNIVKNNSPNFVTVLNPEKAQISPDAADEEEKSNNQIIANNRKSENTQTKQGEIDESDNRIVEDNSNDIDAKLSTKGDIGFNVANLHEEIMATPIEDGDGTIKIVEGGFNNTSTELTRKERQISDNASNVHKEIINKYDEGNASTNKIIKSNSTNVAAIPNSDKDQSSFSTSKLEEELLANYNKDVGNDKIVKSASNDIIKEQNSQEFQLGSDYDKLHKEISFGQTNGIDIDDKIVKGDSHNILTVEHSDKSQLSFDGLKFAKEVIAKHDKDDNYDNKIDKNNHQDDESHNKQSTDVAEQNPDQSQLSFDASELHEEIMAKPKEDDSVNKIVKSNSTDNVKEQCSIENSKLCEAIMTKQAKDDNSNNKLVKSSSKDTDEGNNISAGQDSYKSELSFDASKLRQEIMATHGDGKDDESYSSKSNYQDSVAEQLSDDSQLHQKIMIKHDHDDSDNKIAKTSSKDTIKKQISDKSSLNFDASTSREEIFAKNDEDENCVKQTAINNPNDQYCVQNSEKPQLDNDEKILAKNDGGIDSNNKTISNDSYINSDQLSFNHPQLQGEIEAKHIEGVDNYNKIAGSNSKDTVTEVVNLSNLHEEIMGKCEADNNSGNKMPKCNSTDIVTEENGDKSQITVDASKLQEAIMSNSDIDDIYNKIDKCNSLDAVEEQKSDKSQLSLDTPKLTEKIATSCGHDEDEESCNTQVKSSASVSEQSLDISKDIIRKRDGDDGRVNKTVQSNSTDILIEQYPETNRLSIDDSKTNDDIIMGKYDGDDKIAIKLDESHAHCTGRDLNSEKRHVSFDASKLHKEIMTGHDNDGNSDKKSNKHQASFDVSELRKELIDAENDSKLTTFKTSFNPHILRQEVQKSFNDNPDKHIDKEPQSFMKQVAAAIKIQSLWRGFKTRTSGIVKTKTVKRGILEKIGASQTLDYKKTVTPDPNLEDKSDVLIPNEHIDVETQDGHHIESNHTTVKTKEDTQNTVGEKVFNLQGGGTEIDQGVSEKANENKFSDAALLIQKIWRGFYIRNYLYKAKEQNKVNFKMETKELDKTILDGSIIDGKNGGAKKVEKTSDAFVKAAIQIQKIWRGFTVRKHLKEQALFGTTIEKPEPKVESLKSPEIEQANKKSALKIQSLWRGYQVRKNINIIKNKLEDGEEKRKEIRDGDIMKAATKIQAGVRGYLQRKKYKKCNNLKCITEEESDNKPNEKVKEGEISKKNSLDNKQGNDKNHVIKKLSDDEILAALNNLEKVEISTPIIFDKPKLTRSITVEEPVIVKLNHFPLTKSTSMNKLTDMVQTSQSNVNGTDAMTADISEPLKDDNNNSSDKEITALEREVQEAIDKIIQNDINNIKGAVIQNNYKIANSKNNLGEITQQTLKTELNFKENSELNLKSDCGAGSPINKDEFKLNPKINFNEDITDAPIINYTTENKTQIQQSCGKDAEQPVNGSLSQTEMDSGTFNLNISEEAEIENKQVNLNNDVPDLNSDVYEEAPTRPATSDVSDFTENSTNTHNEFCDTKSKISQNRNKETFNYLKDNMLENNAVNDNKSPILQDNNIHYDRPISIESTDSVDTVIYNEPLGDNNEISEPNKNDSDLESNEGEEIVSTVLSDTPKESLLDENLIDDFQNKLLDEISGKNGEKVSKQFDIEQLRNELKEAGLIHHTEDKDYLQHQNSKAEMNEQDELLEYINDMNPWNENEYLEDTTNKLSRELCDIKEEQIESKLFENKEDVEISETGNNLSIRPKRSTDLETSTISRSSETTDLPIVISKLQSTLDECKYIAQEINENIETNAHLHNEPNKVNDSLSDGFCQIPSGILTEPKYINGKPLSDYVNTIETNINNFSEGTDTNETVTCTKQTANENVDVSDNMIRDQSISNSAVLPPNFEGNLSECNNLETMSSDLRANQIDSQSASPRINAGLLHTGELHDIVVVPLPSNIQNVLEIELEKQNENIDYISEKEQLSKNVSDIKAEEDGFLGLLRTGEMHDTLVYPLTIVEQKVSDTKQQNENIEENKASVQNIDQLKSEVYEIQPSEPNILHREGIKDDSLEKEPPKNGPLELKDNEDTVIGLLHTGEMHDMLVQPLSLADQTICDIEQQNDTDENKSEILEKNIYQFKLGEGSEIQPPEPNLLNTGCINDDSLEKRKFNRNLLEPIADEDLATSLLHTERMHDALVQTQSLTDKKISHIEEQQNENTEENNHEILKINVNQLKTREISKIQTPESIVLHTADSKDNCSEKVELKKNPPEYKSNEDTVRGLLHTGEMHDALVPELSLADKKISDIGQQNEHIDQNKYEIPETNIDQLKTGKISEVRSSEPIVLHTGDIKDSYSEKVQLSKNPPRNKANEDTVTGRLHTGEMHDALVQPLSITDKTICVIERQSEDTGTNKYETLDKNIDTFITGKGSEIQYTEPNLLHTRGIEDNRIEKEQLNNNPPEPTANEDATISLLHTGEMHDALVLPLNLQDKISDIEQQNENTEKNIDQLKRGERSDIRSPCLYTERIYDSIHIEPNNEAAVPLIGEYQNETNFKGGFTENGSKKVTSNNSQDLLKSEQTGEYEGQEPVLTDLVTNDDKNKEQNRTQQQDTLSFQENLLHSGELHDTLVPLVFQNKNQDQITKKADSILNHNQISSGHLNVLESQNNSEAMTKVEFTMVSKEQSNKNPSLLHTGELHDTVIVQHIPVAEEENRMKNKDSFYNKDRDPKTDFENELASADLLAQSTIATGNKLITLSLYEGKENNEPTSSVTNEGYKNGEFPKSSENLLVGAGENPPDNATKSGGLLHTGKLPILLDESEANKSKVKVNFSNDILISKEPLMSVQSTVSQTKSTDDVVTETLRSETESKLLKLPISKDEKDLSKQISENLHRDNELLHTGELHDTIVVTLATNNFEDNRKQVEHSDSPRESSTLVLLPANKNSSETTSSCELIEEASIKKSDGLLHTGEFHDMLVVPLPSSETNSLQKDETNAGGDQHDNIPRQVDSECQTSGEAIAVQLDQVPGAAAPTSRRPQSVFGVASVGTHASTKAALPLSQERGDLSQPSDAHSMERENRKSNNNATNDKNMEVEAATKIQAGFRGYQVRKQLKLKNGSSDIHNQKRQSRRKSSGRLNESGKTTQAKPKESNEVEEKSAVKIQAGIRGFLVRRRQKKQKNPES